MIRRFFHSTRQDPVEVGFSFFNETDTPPSTLNNDNNGFDIQLGMKFKTTVNGYVTGIRFYKHINNIGEHIGQLYTTAGVLLAGATFTNETASGWQTVNLPSPVLITANTVYLTTYYSGSGYYSATGSYFGADITRGPIIAVNGKNSSTNGNGAYIYTNTPTLPTNSYLNANYWVDLVFQPE